MRALGRFCAAAASALLPVITVHGQQPSFKAGTELVVVDVSVVGKDGAPVRGLQEADFTVRIDGQPRPVRSLKFVDESIDAAAAGSAGARAVSSNASEATGRLVLVLVDEQSIAFGGLRAAVESVDKLLAGFGPADKIGLAAIPGPRMLVDYTRQRERIVEAIKRIPGGAGPASLPRLVTVTPGEAFAMERADSIVSQQVMARECGEPPRAGCSQEVVMEGHQVVMEERNRTATFVSGMRGLLHGLGAVDAPKLVVVFSEGFVDPEAASQLAACGTLATAARATIFAMRLDRSLFASSAARTAPMFSPTSMDERSSSIASLDALAGAARGTALEIIGSAELPFTRLARELSGYYLVGVSGEPRDRDGKPHPIKVEVSRPGVTVRARRELVVRAVEKDERKLLAQTLDSPLTNPDLPLRVTTLNMPDEDPARVRVLIVGEVESQPPGEPPATVAVVFTDGQGKSTGDTAQRMVLPLLESGRLSLMLSTALPAGDYTMKVALVRAGRAGSVEHRVSARLTRLQPAGAEGPALTVGDLVVTKAAAADRLSGALHGRVSGDRFVSFAQLGLGPSAPAGLSFVFEVVKSESGPAIVAAVGQLDAAKGRVRSAESVIDARLLPPGDYRLRLRVTAPGADSPLVVTVSSPFSLDRPRETANPGRPVPAASGAASRPGRPQPAGDGLRFVREDTLDPLVLGPFLEEVARLAPAASRPALQLARSGQIDDAVRELAPGAPGDPSFPFLQGLALFRRGETDAAAKAFRTAIAEAPELFVGAFYLGACWAAVGRDSQAIGAWQTSLVGLRRYPAVYRFLGDALIRSGQADRARQLLTEAAARWPDEQAFRSGTVRATVEAGRYEQALDEADKIIEAQPGDSSVLFLAMRSAFQALLEDAGIQPSALLDRLARYQQLYAAAGGLQQALVEEWVGYARSKVRQEK